MPTKKYLSLSEAAEALSISEDELKSLREQNEIRGFADRGNWKFRSDDVAELKRTRSADSDPDVSILPVADDTADDTAADMKLPGKDAGFGTEMMDMGTAGNVLDEEDFGEEPTVIRKKGEDLRRSDSDVRLILDDSAAKSESSVSGGVQDDSDSDVSLVPGTDSDVRLADSMDLGDSDSDVKLVTGDSDVRLSGHEVDAVDPPGADSDSDVKVLGDSSSEISLSGSSGEVNLDTDDLVMSDDEIAVSQSDSDVQLIGADEESDDAGSSLDMGDIGAVAAAGAAAAGLAAGATSDSDVVLPDDEGSAVDDDSGVSLEFDDEEDDSASVLLGAEDSGIALAADSGIALDSPSDSGISLDMDETDEGISLADSGLLDDEDSIQVADDSGIALEAIGDSGISLDDDSGIALDGASGIDGEGTDAEFDAIDSDDQVAPTQFEMAADSSDFDLDSEEMTAEFDTVGGPETSELAALDDSAEGDFDLGEGDFEDGTFDSLDAASVADINLIEGEGAFDDEFGDEAAGSGYGALPVARGKVEPEWSTAAVVGAGVAALLSTLAAVMMFDLLSNLSSYGSGEPITGVLIDSFAGLFG